LVREADADPNRDEAVLKRAAPRPKISTAAGNVAEALLAAAGAGVVVQAASEPARAPTQALGCLLRTVSKRRTRPVYALR
jgi:hypothetical protein